MKNILSLLLAFTTSIVCIGQNHPTSSKYGVGAGESVDGAANTFVGAYTGSTITTGSNNSFLGTESGKQITTGKNNSFIGSQSGVNHTTGDDNTFVGTKSGSNSVGNPVENNNTFIGYNSGTNFSGSNNIIVGKNTDNNQTSGAGNDNIYIGNEFTASYASGHNNVVISNNQGFFHSFLNDDYKLRIHGSSLGPIISGDFQTAQVGINTTNLPVDYSLAVNGNILSEGLKIDEVADWPDYVFETAYDLASIQDLEKQIEHLGHLPNIPSTEEIQEHGVDLEKMDILLLEKIEELTLYIIEQDKEINHLIEQINLKNNSHE